MRNKSMALLIVVALICSMGASCPKSHQERVNVISDAMDKFNFWYEEAEKRAIDLHKTGVLTGSTWNNVVDIREKAKPIAIRLNQNWKLVPATDASIEAFIASKDFQDAVKLALQLVKVAAANDIEIELTKFLR